MNETELSNVIPEMVEQQGIEDIGHSLDNCPIQLGECQTASTDAVTDVGQVLDNHVGHHSESTERQSDEIIAVADVGQTLDSPIGQQGERVDMKAVINQALILSDPQIDADALEYLTEGWTTEFKRAVYARLSEETRSRLREIVRKLE